MMPLVGLLAVVVIVAVAVRLAFSVPVPSASHPSPWRAQGARLVLRDGHAITGWIRYDTDHGVAIDGADGVLVFVPYDMIARAERREV